MQVIRHSDGRCFISNGIAKRYIQEPTIELPGLLWLCQQDAPAEVGDFTVDRMPEILSVGSPESQKILLADNVAGTAAAAGSAYEP
jgi:hypothetical protein